MGQRPEEFAEGARRLAYALPDTAVVDRYPGERKSRIAELRKVSRHQCPPLLPLVALRGEAGGHLAHVFQNRPSIHRSLILSSRGGRWSHQTIPNGTTSHALEMTA